MNLSSRVRNLLQSIRKSKINGGLIESVLDQTEGFDEDERLQFVIILSFGAYVHVNSRSAYFDSVLGNKTTAIDPKEATNDQS